MPEPIRTHVSTPSFFPLNLNSQISKPNQSCSRHSKNHHTHQHTQAAEQLQPQVAASLALYNGASNRASRQRAKAHDSHARASADANLPNIADLCNQSGHETDKTAGREAKECREYDDCGWRAMRGDPDGKGDDRGKQGDADHGVEFAELVGGYAGENTTKDTVMCEYEASILST